VAFALVRPVHPQRISASNCPSLQARRRPAAPARSSLELLTGKAAEPTSEHEQNPGQRGVRATRARRCWPAPGAIVATMLFVQRASSVGDKVAFAAAIVTVVAALWLAMRFSGGIHRVLRDSGVELLTRIAGLLLSAIAVQLIVGAVRALVNQG
jgi:multiple antibiotic resistance protein